MASALTTSSYWLLPLLSSAGSRGPGLSLIGLATLRVTWHGDVSLLIDDDDGGGEGREGAEEKKLSWEGQAERRRKAVCSENSCKTHDEKPGPREPAEESRGTSQ